MPDYMFSLKNPLLRACAYVNIYEKVLDGTTIGPEQMLTLYASQLAGESESLILSRITRHMRNIFWQFVDVKDRNKIAEKIEPQIWNAIAAADEPAKRKTLFQLLAFTAITPVSVDRIHSIWDSTYLDLKIPLNEEDYTVVACELAIRKPAEADSIFVKQLHRIKDEERKPHFKFVKSALVADGGIRDNYFQSLLKKENRQKRDWVLSGLEYLHHPLRNNWGIKYLKSSLEILEEVQMTGDIFFPTDWLRNTFGYYQHKEAAQIVEDFISAHPRYNNGLRLKILQETDDLFRVQKIFQNDRK
jgi:aminopeptidase N